MKHALLLATALSFAATPLAAQEKPRPDRPAPIENQRPDASRTASPDRGVIFQPESVSKIARARSASPRSREIRRWTNRTEPFPRTANARNADCSD